MNRAKIDQRVRYTRDMLKKAMVGLLLEHHISGITVKALCERAMINRSTFYAHYTDPYDLLRQVEEEVMVNLKEYLENDSKDDEPISSNTMKHILEYAKQNADLFKVLLSENCDMAFQKDIIELTQILFGTYGNIDDITRDYLKSFGLTGTIAIINKWLKDGVIETPEKVTELILRALNHGVTGFR